MRKVIFGGWAFIKRSRILLVVVLILSSVLGYIVTAHFKPSDQAFAETKLISQDRPVIASSVESALFPPENAVDGNPKPVGLAHGAIRNGSPLISLHRQNSIKSNWTGPHHTPWHTNFKYPMMASIGKPSIRKTMGKATQKQSTSRTKAAIFGCTGQSVPPYMATRCGASMSTSKQIRTRHLLPTQQIPHPRPSLRQ